MYGPDEREGIALTVYNISMSFQPEASFKVSMFMSLLGMFAAAFWTRDTYLTKGCWGEVSHGDANDGRREPYVNRLCIGWGCLITFYVGASFTGNAPTHEERMETLLCNSVAAALCLVAFRALGQAYTLGVRALLSVRALLNSAGHMDEADLPEPGLLEDRSARVPDSSRRTEEAAVEARQPRAASEELHAAAMDMVSQRDHDKAKAVEACLRMELAVEQAQVCEQQQALAEERGKSEEASAQCHVLAESKAILQDELQVAKQARWPAVQIDRTGNGNSAAVHIRIECPGTAVEDFRIQSNPNWVHVRVIENTLTTGAATTTTSHRGFDRTFTFDYQKEGWFELRQDETRYENGVLLMVLRSFKPHQMSFRSEVARAALGTVEPCQYLMSLTPPQTDVDADSAASWLHVSDGSPQTGSLQLRSTGGAPSSSQEEAEGCSLPIKCYLPGTAFKNPEGGLLLVENLKQGQAVVLTNKTEALVTSVSQHPWRKRAPYDIRTLVTSQGSFEVSASHRIAVPGGEKLACNLKIGDRVLVGSKEQQLLNVCPKKVRTPLYEVSFNPDGIVEAFPVARWGIHTFGEPPLQQPSSSSTENGTQATTSGSEGGLHLLRLVGLANITDAQLQGAIPDHYED